MWQEIKSLKVTRLVDPPAEDAVLPDRNDAEFTVQCRDLVDFARCPARWVRGFEERPTRGYSLSDLMLEMLLQEPEQYKRIAREPDTYKARVMVCPGCDSESASKHCTRCDMDRKIKIVDKQWSSRSKECVEWRDKQAEAGHFVIRAGDWDKAEEAVAAVREDPDVAALLKGSDLNQTMLGRYRHMEDSEGIWISQRLDVCPAEGHALDCAIALVYVTSDAAHHRQSDIAHTRYYHMHAALALDMANQISDGRFREVLQILVEPNPPYVVARRRLSGGFINEGRRLVEETLAALTLCRLSGKYPTFDPSAPGTLNGWTKVDHDPAIHEGSEKADARFGAVAATELHHSRD
jgi:hypothetical protein